MKSDTLLDHAVFQLSPKRSRCDLFVFGKGKTDKLASGFVMPFVTHLKAAEEQISLSVQAIKLEVKRCRNSETWFTKGTVERFVRFVSTPEILELVNTLDTEMSQLEAAQQLYMGAGDELPGPGGNGSGARVSSDETKKELLRAIDVRLSAVKKELVAAFSHASSAGFDLVTVSELQLFADQFSARRLNEACHKFLSLCKRRVDLTNLWKDGTDEGAFLSAKWSEISIDADPTTKTKLYAGSNQKSGRFYVTTHHLEETTQLSIMQKGTNSSQVCCSRGSFVEKEDICKNIEAVVNKEIKERISPDRVNSGPSSKHMRRVRMQDRKKRSEIKESSGSGRRPVIGKSAAIRRHSSQGKTKKRTDTESSIRTPPSATASRDKSEAKKGLNLSDSASYGKPVSKAVLGRDAVGDLTDQVEMQSLVSDAGCEEEILVLKPSTSLTSKLADASVGTHFVANSSTVEYDDTKNQNQWYPNVKLDFNWEEHDKYQTSAEAQSKNEKMNSEGVSDPGQVNGIIGNSFENDSSCGTHSSMFSCKNLSPASDCYTSSSSTPLESQVQRVKQSKANLELNDKLKIKANELEKLFAEHQLRVPGESSSTRRNWVARFSSEPAPNSSHQTPIADAAKQCSSTGKLTFGPVTELVENHGDSFSNHFSEFSFAEDSRGKYYDTYLQRRNEKLMYEWSSGREEKEAKLKSMQDSFEHSMAEIKAKFSGPTDRQNSVSTTS